MSDISPNQWTILERLEKGPEWVRSFHPAKPLLNDLIEKGLVERRRPHLGRGKNMVRLTDAGCAALEIAPADVPATREAPKLAKQQRRAFPPIKAGVSDRVRFVCERFVLKEREHGGRKDNDPRRRRTGNPDQSR